MFDYGYLSMSFRWQTVEQDRQMALFAEENALERRKGVGEFRGLEFLHVRAKKIINEVSGSSMPFRFTINAYRGCSHACVYCFARPTHAYLDLNIADDFDSKIVVKVNAVERVRAELRSNSWKHEGIAMGTNTDPYQRAEGKYQLTRGVIEELALVRNKFSILTKSTLVTRDIDVLTEAASKTNVQVNFSIPTLDKEVWKATEPGTPHPRQRIAAIKKLTDAGLDCGVLMAPILPGLSDKDEQLKEVVEAALDAGARWIAGSPLHLKPGVKEHWMAWLWAAHPNLVKRYAALYRGRSYLPAADRLAVGARVKRLSTSHVAKSDD